MKLTINTQPTTEQVKVRKYSRTPKDDSERAERHRAVARNLQRRYAYNKRVEKWTEALTYLLAQSGEVEELAGVMAKRYNINKQNY